MIAAPRAREAGLLVLIGALGVSGCSGSNGSSTSELPTTSIAPTTTPIATVEPDPTAPEDAETQFVPFVSPQGDLAIVFPGEPSRSEFPVELPDGEVLWGEMYVHERADRAMLLSWVLLPEDSDLSDPIAFLEDARDGTLLGIGGELVDSVVVERGGRPGIEMNAAIAQDSAEANYRSLIMLDGRQLVQAVAVTSTDPQDDAVSLAFLDSFAFIEEAS